jgi:hypothetical protein
VVGSPVVFGSNGHKIIQCDCGEDAEASSWVQHQTLLFGSELGKEKSLLPIVVVVHLFNQSRAHFSSDPF